MKKKEFWLCVNKFLCAVSQSNLLKCQLIWLEAAQIIQIMFIDELQRLLSFNKVISAATLE